MADAEAMGRLISMCLRIAKNALGTDQKAIAQKIASQLRGIGGSSHIGFGKNRVMSLADAIAKVLSEDLQHSTQVAEEAYEAIPLSLTEEGSLKDDVAVKGMGISGFVREDGCEKCYSCGYSKC
jgi:ribonucleoside-diphosphate reductase alpha chain